jgi:neutral ceramidase
VKYFSLVCVLLLSLLGPSLSQANSVVYPECKKSKNFLVGAGIYDITGPAAEEGMMGYARISQKTQGLLQRDWARAFIIQSPCNGKQVVFVNTDLAMLFQGVQQEVLRQLKERFGEEYNASNTVITAIHQHSGPGGYSLHALYNITTLGFNRKHFQTICDGIVQAIVRARKNKQPATISIAQGQLSNASVNRSPSAYLLNPKSERKKYRGDRDTTMTLIRFNGTNGKPIGTINWFPVHGTSFSKHNHLISGDNKGYAQYLFEKDFRSDHAAGSFVAAFAQSNAGDLSPNMAGDGRDKAGGKARVESSGGKQYREAKRLFKQARTRLVGGVDYRQQYIAMGAEKILPQFSNDFDTVHRSCPAAMGESMMAGTRDGETGFAKQGITDCKGLKAGGAKLICDILTKKTACQGVKPIILEGNVGNHPLTPKILPLSVVTIGDLAIVVSPFELTTMAGRRVRALVQKELKSVGVKYVVISGYANGYGGYVTTPEEYQAQRYEGASNLFGERSLNMQLQAYHGLSQALVSGKKAPASALVPDVLSWPQGALQLGVIFDSAPSGKRFGDVALPVKQSYRQGETVTVQFYGSSPKNKYHNMGSFLTVEKKVGDHWVVVRNDNDWDTSYAWERQGIAASLITIQWQVPQGQAPGTYRIGYFGDAKSLQGPIKRYSGYSGVFVVAPLFF